MHVVKHLLSLKYALKILILIIVFENKSNLKEFTIYLNNWKSLKIVAITEWTVYWMTYIFVINLVYPSKKFMKN